MSSIVEAIKGSKVGPPTAATAASDPGQASASRHDEKTPTKSHSRSRSPAREQTVKANHSDEDKQATDNKEDKDGNEGN
eukprot:12424793-Karenia_brevis.AAC.1